MLGSRAAVAAAICALLIASTAAAQAGGDASGADSAALGAAPPENLIVVMTDDMTTSALRYMTETRRAIRSEGVRYTHQYAVQPLCCPSRTTFLTGQYPHNHGVRGNAPPLGGYELLPEQTVNRWVQDAGYRTAWVGKFLNGYGARGNSPEEVPPGWDEWAATTGAPSYYDYTLNVNGSLRRFGSAKKDYLTDVLAKRAVKTFKQSDSPLFMVVAPYAPHNDEDAESATPAPRHRGALAGEPLPSPKAFDDNLSDKPRWVRQAGDNTKRSVIRKRWRRGGEALLAVDDLVGRLHNALAKKGELDDTVLIFTSDNGRMFGEHSLTGKNAPYEPAISVPLLIRGPGFAAGSTGGGLTGNIDLAPTIVELTGADAGAAMDGRSLLDPAPRQELLIEGGKGEALPPVWSGIRTPDQLYVEYGTGDVELYDMGADPAQLRNVAGRPAYAALQAELAAELEAARDCAGAGCP